MTIRFITAISCFLSLTLAVAAAEPTEMPGVSGLNVRAADGLQFSPDGKWLFAAMGASTSADRIAVWDTSTLEKAAELTSPAGDIYSFAVSPTGGQLATGHSDSMYVWEHEDHGGWKRTIPTELIGDETAKLLKQHPTLRTKVRRVHAVSFSPDGQTLAWSWEDRKIHLWDLAAGKEVNSLPVDLPLTSYGGNMHFLSEQQLLVMGIKTGNGYEIQLWDVDSSTRSSLRIPRGGMSSNADVRPDGQVLAVLVSSAEGKMSKPTELWIWNLQDGKARKVGPGPLPMMFGPRFSPDGETIAIGMYANHRFARGRITLLDAATQRRRGGLTMARRGTCPAHIAFSPDGNYLAAAVYHDQAPVQLWRLTTDTSESASGR